MNITIAAIAGLATTTAASAAMLGYTAEQGGNTWTLPDGRLVGLLGLDAFDTNDRNITADDILEDVTFGQAVTRNVQLFNGVDNLGSSLSGLPDIATYEATTFFSSRIDFATGDNLPFSNGVDPFTGAELLGNNQRIVSLVFVVFEGAGNLIIAGDFGSETFNGSGSNGPFPAELIPAPGAASLAGIAGIAALRRRR